jgi:hypothetical protein
MTSRAKRRAERRGAPASRAAEAHLASFTGAPHLDRVPPVLKELRGSLKHADLADYRRYLREKYR